MAVLLNSPGPGFSMHLLAQVTPVHKSPCEAAPPSCNWTAGAAAGVVAGAATGAAAPGG